MSMKKLIIAFLFLISFTLLNSCKKNKLGSTPSYGTFGFDSDTYAPNEFSSSASGNNWCMVATLKKQQWRYECLIYTAGGQAPADGVYNLKSSTTSLGPNDASVVISWVAPEGPPDIWNCTSTNGTLSIHQFGVLMREIKFTDVDGLFGSSSTAGGKMSAQLIIH